MYKIATFILSLLTVAIIIPGSVKLGWLVFILFIPIVIISLIHLVIQTIVAIKAEKRLFTISLKSNLLLLASLAISPGVGDNPVIENQLFTYIGIKTHDWHFQLAAILALAGIYQSIKAFTTRNQESQNPQKYA